jgi:hypothetical protein
MKKVAFILLVALFASCSKDNSGCECTAQIYQFKQKTYTEFYSDDCKDDGRVIGGGSNLEKRVTCE